MKYLLFGFVCLASLFLVGCSKRSDIQAYNETSLSQGQLIGTLPDGRVITAYQVRYFHPDSENPTEGMHSQHYIYVVDNAKSTTTNYMDGKVPVTSVTIEK